MIVGDPVNWPLVELLLCASDCVRVGYTAPITAATEALGIVFDDPLTVEARHAAMDAAEGRGGAP